MMKTKKVIELHEFPEEFQDKIRDKMNHCGGNCSWYPGDGYFKPLSEVNNMNNIMFFKKENINTKDVHVYEKGDDPIGDWIMDNCRIKLAEEILIIR